MIYLHSGYRFVIDFNACLLAMTDLMVDLPFEERFTYHQEHLTLECRHVVFIILCDVLFLWTAPIYFVVDSILRD